MSEAWSKTNGRTEEVGLHISIFVYLHEPRTTARYCLQDPDGDNDDPRPLLRRAIETMVAELADVDNCPVHAAKDTQ